MTHYSSVPRSVRVDFFLVDLGGKPRKWYTTEAMEWLTWNGEPDNGGKLIHDAFEESLIRHLDETAAAGWPNEHRRLAGMFAVCLEPYHENAHPVVMMVPERGGV